MSQFSPYGFSLEGPGGEGEERAARGQFEKSTSVEIACGSGVSRVGSRTSQSASDSRTMAEVTFAAIILGQM